MCAFVNSIAQMYDFSGQQKILSMRLTMVIMSDIFVRPLVANLTRTPLQVEELTQIVDEHLANHFCIAAADSRERARKLQEGKVNDARRSLLQCLLNEQDYIKVMRYRI